MLPHRHLAQRKASRALARRAETKLRRRHSSVNFERNLEQVGRASLWQGLENKPSFQTAAAAAQHCARRSTRSLRRICSSSSAMLRARTTSPLARTSPSSMRISRQTVGQPRGCAARELSPSPTSAGRKSSSDCWRHAAPRSRRGCHSAITADSRRAITRRFRSCGKRAAPGWSRRKRTRRGWAVIAIIRVLEP